MTFCMPCNFGLLPHPRSQVCAQPIGLLKVTVTDRWTSLLTAGYGTRVVRSARTTMLATGGNGSQLDRRVRLVSGDHRIAGKSREARGRSGTGLSLAMQP
jgi:hypothetical protein